MNIKSVIHSSADLNGFPHASAEKALDRLGFLRALELVRRRPGSAELNRVIALVHASSGRGGRRPSLSTVRR